MNVRLFTVATVLAILAALLLAASAFAGLPWDGLNGLARTASSAYWNSVSNGV